MKDLLKVKQRIFLFLIILIVSACNSGDKYVVKGHVEGGNRQMIYLQQMNLNETVTIDSVKMKDGDFTFKQDRLSEPTFLILKLSDNNFITLLADSTENIVVNAKADNLEESYEIENSLGSVYIKVFNKKISTLNSELKNMAEQYKALDENDKDNKSKLEESYSQLIKKHKTFVGEFIMDNPRSFAGYYALFQNLYDNTPVLNVANKEDQLYFSTLATSLNLYYAESERAGHLYNYVLNVKTQQQRQKFTEEILAQAQDGFIDIEVPDITGNKVKLSSLEGKTILLSFWASWDEKSVAENKNLKNLYSQFHSKGFEIYQVSLDKSKVLWESAIKKYELPWINVSDLRYTDSYPANLYNVRQLPANYLISPQGEIIGKDLFGNRLKDRLNDIL